ncbi:hypothetical protein B0T16DRAFT_459841 [Cercophora newfieldiana]|uniref:Uncharacterized protein n=1 Tax=Cercophora newfieldiana TaxID=92897 RepID=A0AA40CNP8_9PEZI|nr:hypothetical protein B0T16DRAFT_459841 [Cercophora newfieldiana]
MSMTWPNPSPLTIVTTLPCTSYLINDNHEWAPSCKPTSLTDEPYFSPGICFFGWTVGCSVLHYNDWGSTRLRPVASDETAMFCVPSGYGCWTVTHAAEATVPVSQGIDTLQPVFQIRWKSSDLSILETHPLTPGLRLAAETSSAVSVGTNTPTDSVEGRNGTSGPADSSGLTTAAKVGTGVGAAILAVLLFASFFLFLRRYRSTRLKQAGSPVTGDTPGSDGAHAGAAELGDTGKFAAELGEAGAAKVDAQELDT